MCSVERPLSFRQIPYPTGLFETLTDTIIYVPDGAHILLEIFSLLDPDHIQDRLLEAATDDALLKNLDHIKKSDDHLKDLLSGLISRNNSEDEQRLPSFHMHRLLQDCVQLNSNSAIHQNAPQMFFVSKNS